MIVEYPLGRPFVVWVPLPLALGEAMAGPRLDEAVPVFEAWVAIKVGQIDDEGRLANRMAELAMTDASLTSVSGLAGALAVSERTLHRLATKYVGLSPYHMIRRRRLQEAAEAVRQHPEEPLADAAARFGFADQAHLAREARQMLGFSLSDYRRELE